jgi:sulfate adenylyltransferase subunit 2
MSRGEHFRVFPLSNFTERDVWQYLWREKVALPKLYFAHRREVIERDGMLLAASDFTPLQAGEVVSNRLVRFRTIGDMTCTGAVESTAATVDEVLAELAGSVTSERGTRYDDRRSEAAMEDRKRQGYF